jgi:hypothetical protein
VDATGLLGDDGEELLAELAAVPCALLMECVPGESLAQASDAFQVGSCSELRAPRSFALAVMCRLLVKCVSMCQQSARGKQVGCSCCEVPGRTMVHGKRDVRQAHHHPLLHLPLLQEPQRQQTCHDLGRMFLLDMLLGNADRLPCVDLSWRGNPGNVLFGSGQGKYGGKLVAIDSAVQRRPPALRSSADDERTERLAQLLLHSRDTAADVLKQVGAVLAGAVGVWLVPGCGICCDVM